MNDCTVTRCTVTVIHQLYNYNNGGRNVSQMLGGCSITQVFRGGITVVLLVQDLLVLVLVRPEFCCVEI